MAVYLYVENPPEDYPDIDILLDASSAQAQKFLNRLRRTPLFVLLVTEDSDTDVFATFMYGGEIQLDVFTSQEVRKFLTKPRLRKGLRLEPIEGLIIEKLIRHSYEDVLMAIDLLATRLYDRPTLVEYARSYRLMPRLVLLEHLAHQYADGKISAEEIRKWARRMR